MIVGRNRTNSPKLIKGFDGAYQKRNIYNKEVKEFLAGVSQGRQNLRYKNGKEANDGDKDVAVSKDAQKMDKDVQG